MSLYALSVIAHPSPHSFSHAMAAVAANTLRDHGIVHVTRDLYGESFDPIQRRSEQDHRASDDTTVEAHCADLTRADLILIFHPNWWGQPPAILKGWIDRVFRPGVAYDYPRGVGPEGIPIGLLCAHAALVFNTSNTPAERESREFTDPLDALWRRCVFGLCGVTRVERRTFAPVASSTAEQRERWLAEVRTLVSQCARSVRDA